MNKKVNCDAVPKFGEKFWDYENKCYEVLSEDNCLLYTQMIVAIDNEIKLGYATPNKYNNIQVILNNGNKYIAISKNIFPEGTLFFNQSCGKYQYEELGYSNFQKAQELFLKKDHIFPYNIIREYSFMKNKNSFDDKYKIDDIFNSKIKKLIPYTFGLEYETSAGCIPQEECYRSGLAPLKDGSIQGNEYASIVMNSKNGFERIKYQTELLKRYTKFDKDCSLHIHFGKFPLTEIFISTFYNVFVSIQDEIEQSIPILSFNTGIFKSSGKDYCRKLKPVFVNSFGELYTIILGGENYKKDNPLSLVKPHPRDPKREQKWNIPYRYCNVNLINACFYKTCKTIEFRFLRPTTNHNKIINWIFVFSAILKYCEYIISNVTNINENELSKIHDFKSLNLRKILNTIYPANIAVYLDVFLDDLNNICHYQSMVNDRYGNNHEFEDYLITENIFDYCEQKD